MVVTESPCQGSSSAPTARPGWTVQQGPTLKGGPGDHVRVYASRDSQTGARMVAKVYSKKDIRQQPELRRMVRTEYDFHKTDAPEAPEAIVRMAAHHQDEEHFWMGFPDAGRPIMEFVSQPRDWWTLWLNTLLGFEFIDRVVPAMTWLHSRGKVYLDLKPEQLLVQPDHEARRLAVHWVDFGSLTPPGQCRAFTDGFVPPEALSSGTVEGFHAAATPAWDAWGVGTVLMAVITGLSPYKPLEWQQQGPHGGGGGGGGGGCAVGSFRAACMASPAWRNLGEDSRQLRKLAEDLTHPDPAKRPSLSQVEARPYFQRVRTGADWRQAQMYVVWQALYGGQAAGEVQPGDAAAPGAAVHEAMGVEGRREAHGAPGGPQREWEAERAGVYAQLAAAQQAAEKAEALRGEVEVLRTQLQQQRDQAAAALQQRDAAAQVQQHAQQQIQAQLRLQFQLQGAAKDFRMRQLQGEVARWQAEAGELSAQISTKDEIIAQMAEQVARQQAAGEEARARVQHVEEQRGKLLAVKVEYKETARRLRAESIRLISEARVKGDHAARLQGWLKLTADGAETARGEAAALRGGLARMQACLGAVREECAAVDSCVRDGYSGSGGDDDGSEGWDEGGSEPQALSGGSCGATTTSSSSGAANPASGCVAEAGSRSVDDAHSACADVPVAAGVLVPDASATDGAGGAGALAALGGADDTQACASPSGGACEGAAEAASCACGDVSCGVLEVAVAPATACIIAAGVQLQQYAASEEQVQADGASCSGREQGEDEDASAAGRSDCSVVVTVRVRSPCRLKAGPAAAAVLKGRDCSGAGDAADRAGTSPPGATAVSAGGEGAAPGVGAGARAAWWGRLRGKARQAKAALRRGVLAPLCSTGAEADRF